MAPRYDPAAQQRSSPLASAACNPMRVWLLLFDRSVPFVTPPYSIFPLCCRFVRISIACP